MAQLVIAAAGAALGGYLVPGVIAAGITGAQAGWIVGSLVGSAFAPAQKVQGPRLSDLSVGSSAYGTPIPFVQGSPRLAGQIVYASSKREIATTTRQGGKGGGAKQKVTTYTYEVDLLILLTDNIIPGITRIWSNGKLIWNKSLTADAATIAASDATSAWTRLAIYTGAASQLPDPTYEAAVGTANAPAYRGRGAAFIQGLQLGSSGQIPNLTFEIGSAMPTLSGGASASLTTGTFAQTDSAAMSATKALVVFRDSASPLVGPMSVNNPSGDTITHGSAYTSQSSNSTAVRISPISSTKAIFSWSQNTGSLLGYAAILNVSGDVVSTVTPTTYASFVINADAIFMSATQAIVVYSSGGIKAMVLDISGSDIITTNSVFSSGLPTSGISNLDATKLSAISILVTWVASGSPNILRGVVLTLSGSSLVSGGVMDFTSDAIAGLGTSTHSVVAMSEGSALVICAVQGSSYPQALLVTTAGGATDPYQIAAYPVNYASLAKIDSSHALCVFSRVSDGFLQAVVLGASAGSVLTLVEASTSYPTVAVISGSKAICTYVDASADLRSIVITLS